MGRQVESYYICGDRYFLCLVFLLLATCIQHDLQLLTDSVGRGEDVRVKLHCRIIAALQMLFAIVCLAQLAI